VDRDVNNLFDWPSDPNEGTAMADGTPDDPYADAARLLEIINGSWMAQALRAAAELGLPDQLAAGPREVAELAAVTGTHPPALHRLLRALVTIGVCAESDGGAFTVTPMGRLLGAEVEGSVRSWAVYWGRYLWPEWAQLTHSVRTGRSGREVVSGSPHFESLPADPERAGWFNGAMADVNRLSTHGVVVAYDFSGCARIVDVGGGYGDLIAAVLAANPSATGVLFDLPHAVAKARPNVEKAGVGARCEFVAGSFFDGVPAGADTYLLKSVLHDWDDDGSRAILRACRAAMAGAARLLVMERLIPERLEHTPEHAALARSDLTMLVAHAAPERTGAQFRALLRDADLRIGSITPLPTGYFVIEALPGR
jgi:orsellinic acid C2-O-methyltransferase